MKHPGPVWRVVHWNDGLQTARFAVREVFEGDDPNARRTLFRASRVPDPWETGEPRETDAHATALDAVTALAKELGLHALEFVGPGQRTLSERLAT
jgi:hypothetical protein